MNRFDRRLIAIAALAVAVVQREAVFGRDSLRGTGQRNRCSGGVRGRLDLGERNPHGTVFYRTADFQFTR